MPISYTKRGWTNNSPPAINAANLGAMDDALKLTADTVDAATATPAANAIPKADGSGKLDAWVSDASESTAGKVQLASTTPAALGTAAKGSATKAAKADHVHQMPTLDEIGEGTTYNRVQAAKATALNNGDVSAYMPDATTIVKGKVQLAGDGESAGGKAVQANDTRLSNARTPTAHATSHKHGGSDEVATATPAANAIPKADGSGKLDSWVSDASTSVKGKVQLATSAELESGTDASKVLTPALLRGMPIKRTKMPDGTTAVYSQDAWATTDDWGTYNGTISVSTTPGSLRFTATDTSIPGTSRSIAGIRAKTVCLRYKTNFSNASSKLRITCSGGTITVIDLPQTTAYQVATVRLPASFASESIWPIITNATVGDWFEINWIWFGDYSYLAGTLSEEAARIANQLGDTAGVGVAASGTISLGAGGNYVAGETITIGGFVYTFRALVSELTAPGDVLIGAALGNSHENLNRAISRVLPSLYDASSGGTDPRYYTPAAYIHPLVSALMPGAIVNLTAILPGDFGNTIALSTSAPTKCIFSASTLTGGYSATAKKLATLAAPIIAGNGTRPAAALIELTDTTKIGYEHAIDVAAGGTVTMPSGGTWIWVVYGYGATGTCTGYTAQKKGTLAGGGTLTVNSANATVWYRRYA